MTEFRFTMKFAQMYRSQPGYSNMTLWNIALDSWVIQDGNYPDFKRGQTAEFALCFHTDEEFSDINNSTELQAALIKETRYKVTAKVIYISREVWIIDFGLLAYNCDRPPKEIKVGSTFVAEIELRIDHFLYFESMSNHDNIPPMIYTWKIQKILQQTAAYKEIEATDAWIDDNQHAEYILICEKIDMPEKRTSATAIYS